MRQRLGLAAVLMAATSLASANTYTVTSTADSGAGTLRQAILDANASAGADTIAFAIVGSGVHTIAPASALPAITGPVTIDGYTQAGSSANTNPTSDGLNTVLRIEIDGTSLGFSPGLDVRADGVTIRGLVINRCAGSGIETTGALHMLVIEGCFLGTNAAGDQALVPYGGAILLRSNDHARIGGTTAAARNLISGGGNAFFQMSLGEAGGGMNDSLVAGNLVGTDVTGRKRFADGVLAMFLRYGTDNTIGGTSASARNVFVGAEVSLGGPIDTMDATDNHVQGNFFGTDVTGEVVLGCYSQCITAAARNNTIGGTAAGAGNRIAGSLGNAGISVYGSGTVIQGNFIGTDETGTLRLGNSYWGIVVNASDVTIGGTGPGEGNLIANNLWGGVGISGQNVEVRGNSIFNNPGDSSVNGLAIDLAAGNGSGMGVSLNDVLDADTGPNGYQNYPIISSVAYGGASTTVVGTLDSTASTVFDVDFYANPACSSRPQELPEGRTYLGSAPVTTDGSGHGVFNAVLPQAVAAGSPIAATATNPAGNTSELSPRFVLSLEPQAGPASGLNDVQARGLAFEAGATVTVGGVPATNISVLDANTIMFNVPALPAGSINALTVANPGGGLSGTLPNAWIANFNDVLNGHQFHAQVTKLVANGVTAGVGGGNFGVGQNTLRQQMAVFLLKSKYGVCYVPPPCNGDFADVACPSTFANWIEALADEGITGGCGGNNFCPANPVRRDQMAAFLLKAKHGSSYVPPPCSGDFDDVACPSLFANWIEQLADEGITGGCGGNNYCPLNNATRGQMAAFLVNTFTLP